MPLLVGMLLLLPLYPLLEGDPGEPSGLLVEVAFTALIALGVLAAAARPWLLVVGVLVAIPTAVLNFISVGDAAMLQAESIFATIFFLFATVAVVIEVMGGRIHPADLVKGGIAIYLLIGLTFAQVYRLIEAITPAAFVFENQPDQGRNWADFLYYSFVTLTTLGYGDVHPVSRFAQSFSITEAIIGPLFIAIFIANMLHLQMRRAARGGVDIGVGRSERHPEWRWRDR